MGFVSTFCPISGCSPIAADALTDSIDVEDALDQLEGQGIVDTTILTEALEQLKSEQGGKASELTVVGIVTKEGAPVFEEESPDGDKLLEAHSEDFRIVTHCEAAGMFEFGSVENSELSQNYLVSYGACVMVLSWALPLLYLATDCRMTARRIWRLCQKHGHNVPQNHYVLPGINYGEVEQAIDQFLLPLPKWKLGDHDRIIERLWKLGEEAKTVEEAKKALIDEGGYWIWMSPNDFPLKRSSTSESSSSDAKLPDSFLAIPSSRVDQLPFDVVSHLASFLPLPSLVSLASANRSLRQTLLGSPSSRSQTMRKWLLNEGRYWLPQEVNLQIAEPKLGAVPRVDELAKPTLKELELEDTDDDWWYYVRRCVRSGSMRNRRRIWSVAIQLEEKANELGV